MYVSRSSAAYYIENGSNVNVAVLDISKMFDTVKHSTLFRRLLDVGMPPGIVQLLASLYRATYVCVKRGTG